MSILPILVLFSLLARHDLITKTEAYTGVLLALSVAFVGFLVLQRMVAQLSALAHTVSRPAPSELEAPPRVADLSSVRGLGQVVEIGQLCEAFGRLLEEVQHSRELAGDLLLKLTTLHGMVEQTACVTSIQELLALVLRQAMGAVRAGVGSIMLLDPDRRTLRIAAARGLADDLVDRIAVRVGDGIAGKVAELGEPLLVQDIETDPRFAKANDAKYGGGSFICVPLRVGTRLVGVINLAKKEYASVSPPDLRSFSSTDLQFVNAIVTYCWR